MSNLGGKNVSEDTDKDVPGVNSVSAGTNTTITGTAADPVVNADTQLKNTTKGDLEGFSTVAARIPVGTNDQVLTADSTAAEGVAWKTPAAGGSAVFRGALLEEDTDTSRGTGQFTATYDVEVYDTDSFADIGTDNDRITIPSGVTKVQASTVITATGLAAGVNNAVEIFHFDSGDTLIRRYSHGQQMGFNDTFNTVTTPVITVSLGDYFLVKIVNADSSWTQTYVALGVEYKDGTL